MKPSLALTITTLLLFALADAVPFAQPPQRQLTPEQQAQLQAQQEATRKEPGCIWYFVQRSRENSRHYLIYEQYKDQAALDTHRASSHFKEYGTNGFYRFVEKREAELYDPIQ